LHTTPICCDALLTRIFFHLDSKASR